MKYRLLKNGEKFQDGDESLDDNCETWSKLDCHFPQFPYNPLFNAPVRREIFKECLKNCSNLGISVAEVMAIINVLSFQETPMSEIATSMRETISSLTEQTKKSEQTFLELGISRRQADEK